MGWWRKKGIWGCYGRLCVYKYNRYYPRFQINPKIEKLGMAPKLTDKTTYRSILPKYLICLPFPQLPDCASNNIFYSLALFFRAERVLEFSCSKSLVLSVPCADSSIRAPISAQSIPVRSQILNSSISVSEVWLLLRPLIACSRMPRVCARSP